MEERLVRAFAGLINQLRQQDLGIKRYIWRGQDDAKVGDSHAEYDDQCFVGTSHRQAVTRAGAQLQILRGTTQARRDE
jgi:hypothetical protein